MPGLKIVLETDAAERGVRALKKNLETLGASAASNEKEFKRLEDRMREGLKAEKAKSAVEGLQKALNLTRAETAQFYKSIGDYNSALKTMTSGTESATKSLSALKTVGVAVISVFAGYAISDFTKQIVSAGVAIDSLTRSYEVITGSQRLAAAEMKYINETSKSLGLNLNALENSYKGLLAASQGTALEGEKTRKIFSAVAEASAVLGVSADDTTGTLRALEQMISKGSVQAEELRGQLGERLPGAFNIAAEAMGVSTSKLSDMLQKGEVLADDLLPKLADVLKNRYGAAAEEAGETSRAAFENFTTSVIELKRTLAASGIVEYLAKVARNATDMINSVGGAINAINADKAKTSIAQYDEAIVAAKKNLAEFTSLWGNNIGLVPDNLKDRFNDLKGAVDALEASRAKLALGLRNEQDWKGYRDVAVSTFGKVATETDKAAEALEEKLRKAYAHTTEYRLAEAKKELAAYIQTEGAKPEYVAMLQDEIAALEKKANVTSITDRKKVTTAYKKELEDQKRALESFNDDYKKATLSTFDYEVDKLDEAYKEREKLVKAGLITEWELQEWYADKYDTLYQEDVARFIDAQEKKASAIDKSLKAFFSDLDNLHEEEVKKQEEAVEAQQDAYNELYDGIYGFTRDVIDDWDDMGNTLVDIAKDMVKDIVAAFVTQKIAIPIYMYAADMVGISTGLASGMSPSSGGLASMTSPISSLFTIGKTAYTLVTEGVSAAVSDLVGADLLGSISSALFGKTAATAASTASTATGAASGAASGAGIGAAGAIGLAAAAFMAIDQFLGSHDKADPDIYVQSPTGGLTESTATYTVSNRDAVTDEIVTIFDAAFASLDKTLDANIVDAVTASAFRGKARITDLDETDANALINALVESAFSGDYTGSVSSLDGLFGVGGMVNRSVKSDGEFVDYWNNTVTGFTKGLDGNYSKGLSDILMDAIGLDSGIFDFEFLRSLQAEGENLFDTFANFAIVVQETDGFVANITRQMNEFGFTVEEAFANILVVISVLDEMQASADALTNVTAITTLRQLTESWYALIDSLEAAYATTSQISEAESTMATVLGSSISGLTADALQSALSSGGDIDSIIKTAIETSAYADIAQKIADEYVSGINNQIGQAWLDTGGDLQAVIEVMQNIDTTEAQKAIAELRESFGLMADTAEDQAKDIAEYNELLAAAAAKRRELSIDILYAQGEAEQALAMEREDIINELIETYGSESGTIIDLQKQLWALNDAAESTTKALEDLLSVVEDARSNYETALNTALSAAKSEYDALVESFKSAEYQLNTVRAAHIKEQKTLLQEQTDAYSDAIKDLTSELSNLESIAANLKEYREGLLLSDESPLLPGEMLAEAERQFAIAGPENLVDASQNLLSAGRGAMTDYKEYAELFAMVQSRVSGAEADVKTQSQALQEQIDMASVQVELLNAEIELMSETSETLMSMEQAEAEYYAAKLELDNSSFAEDIAFYEKELDRLDRINGSVLSLDQATKNYQSALISAISQGYRNLEYNFQSELNELKDSRGIGASFADGGIISGPSSGYNVMTQFHGTEMIIPESKFNSLESGIDSDLKSLIKALIAKVSEDSKYNKKIHRILDRVDSGQGSLLVRTE